MARSKKPTKGNKRSAKVAKRKAKKNREDHPQNCLPDGLAPFELLTNMPADFKRQMLESMFGDEMADELLSTLPQDDPESEAIYDETTERLLDRVDAARTIVTRRERLREVVEHNPNCIEGWTWLAELQDRPEEAISFYEQAAAAAKRELPDFDEYVGHFWEVHETRPYISVLFQLFDCQKAANLTDEAIETARDILRLNPNDNTGIRHHLLPLLLECQRHDEAEALLKTYENDAFPEWSWGKLLLTVQLQRSEKERLRLLKQAHKDNPHVIDYLLGRRPMPIDPPDFIEVAGESGAIACVATLRRAWLTTPGSISWLRQVAGDAKLLKLVDKTDLVSEFADSPFAPLVGDMLPHDLPPHPEPVWTAGIYEFPPVHREGSKRKKKAWAMYIIAQSGPINIEMCEKKPKAVDLWEWIEQTMQTGDVPGRPEAIEFPQSGIYRQLTRKSFLTGIRLSVCETPPPLDDLFAPIARKLDWEGRGGTFTDDEILALPQDATDVWECDLEQLDQQLRDDQGELRRACSVLVASARDELVLTHDLIVKEPDELTLLCALTQAMLIPLVGEPHRPGEVLVRHDDDRLILLDCLAAWNINVRVSSEMEILDDMRQELSGVLQKGDQQGLSSIPHLTNDDQAAFYEAASRFYLSQPWRRLLEDDVIRIDCETHGPDPLFVLVMGQSGIQTGLSFYRDRHVIHKLFAGEEADAIREITGYSLTFEEEGALPGPDLDTIVQFGWPIATPEAYPTAFRIDAGPEFVQPDRVEIQMLTAVLRGVQELSASKSDEVTLSQGDVTVRCARDGSGRGPSVG